MTTRSKFILAALLLVLVCVPWAPRARAGEKDMTFVLESKDIRAGERISRRFTCEGEDVSPELHWHGVPPGTKSLALIVEDPDAPMGTFIHWVLYNIPADLGGLSRGASRTTAIKGEMREGVSGFGRTGYNGPCPPPGHGDHRYFFNLVALDIKKLDVKDNANKADVDEAMTGHILAEASLMGTYSR